MIDYISTIRENILENPDFVQATFSGRQRGQTLRWKRLTIRPVLIKDGRHLQFSFFDDTKDVTKNYTGEEAEVELNHALNLHFRNFHVQTLKENIQVNLTKKGKVIFNRTETYKPKKLNLSHDRQKSTVLAEGENIPFLRAIGVMTQDGRIKAARRSKFQQINSFLKILSEIEEIEQMAEPVRMVDFGCGNAYLTFASYHYLKNILGKDVRIVGVDINKDLVQRNKEIAAQLEWKNLSFEHSRITDYRTSASPNIVTALHACDTASDDAIAQGLLMKSQVIIVAPCCHHHLQAQLKEKNPPSTFAPVMRYGLLYERQADIITDTFRALILRMMGYRVGVVEFVSPDHTPKNLLLRAIRKGEPGHSQSIDEYLKLKEFWQVNPHLYQLLESELEPLIQHEIEQDQNQ